MRRGWLAWMALGAALGMGAVAGCGSGSGEGGGGSPDGATGADAGLPDQGLSGDAPGADASLHDTGASDGSVRDTTARDQLEPPPLDATLDIAFPDAFYYDAPPPPPPPPPPDSGLIDGGCGPNAITCNGNTAVTCTNGVATSQSCAAMCAPGYGCVTCMPGQGTCNGNVGTVCNAAGTGTTTNTCDPDLGLACTGGVCVGACADIGQSYIGCEYYAVTMSNSELDQSTFNFQVAIANTSTQVASVKITGGALGGATRTASVNPGSVTEVVLPWVPALSGAFPTIPTTEIAVGGGYHIKSTAPVTIYELNARDYEVAGTCASDGNSPPCHSYTNDASLLLPVNAMTGNYRVAVWPTWHSIGCAAYDIFGNCIQFACTASSGSYQSPGDLVVVATQDGTTVTVNTTGTIQTGAGLGVSGGTVTLNHGDVLQVASALNATNPCSYGSDLSGSLVTANKPVEVFGAHDCTFIPAGVFACDHLEQVQFPLETLRGDYLVTVPHNDFAAAGTPGKQYVKIVGTVAGTTLTFDPASVHAAATIGAGQVLTFEVTQHFHLSATQPVLVHQYMESQNSFTSSLTATTAGDPSQSAAVATAQFRTQYTFVAPANYQQNWVNVIAPAGASVQVDGATVGGFTAIGASGYSVAVVSLCGNNAAGCSGTHTATSNVPFGIEVYGYGAYTSYMFPGGLNLNR